MTLQQDTNPTNMKTNFVKTAVTLLISAIAVIVGCKKNDTVQPATTTPNTNTDNYSSMANFFAKNGVPTQTYTITASVAVLLRHKAQ